MLADYASTGLTAGTHPLALLRPRLPAGTVTSHALETLPHGRRVRMGGMVVARQRPGTAGGVVFILLEDEHGTINLIIPPRVYERHRLLVRTEPLILASGKLEKLAAAGGAINVLVDRIDAIDAPDQILAEVKDFSMLDEQVRQGLAAQRAATAHGRCGRRGGGLPGGRPAGDELRLRPAPVTRRAISPADHTARPALYGSVACLVSHLFVAFWVVVAFGLFFVAARGGLGAARATISPDTRRSGRVLGVVFTVVALAFGIALPVALLVGNKDNAQGQIAGLQAHRP